MGDPREVADCLHRLGYSGLFQQLSNTNLDELWSSDHAAFDLRQLALDAQQDDQNRFLAAEVLFRKDPSFPPPDHVDDLAQLYARMLKGTATGNMWGLPGHFVGDAGRHLVSLGEEGAQALRTLLDDETGVAYEGSEESTIGSERTFRVKDVAAFLIDG